MRINIENGMRHNPKLTGEVLIENLKELRERCLKGDDTAIKEFFDTHRFGFNQTDKEGFVS